MNIINLTNGKIISHNCLNATTILQKTLGLINPQNPRYIYLNTRLGIHTMFLRKATDILLLGDDFKVVTAISSLKPYRIFMYHPKYQHVIEMPSGTIIRTGITIGDKILLE